MERETIRGISSSVSRFPIDEKQHNEEPKADYSCDGDRGGRLDAANGGRAQPDSQGFHLVSTTCDHEWDLHADTDPDDFVRALVGVFHTTALPGWEASARRIVDILIAGSRATAKQDSASPGVRKG